MRLPRGFTVTGSTCDDTERPGLPLTTWIPCAGGRILGRCHDPDEAVALAWSSAAKSWTAEAVRVGAEVFHSNSWDVLCRAEYKGAHANIYATGNVSFGGKLNRRKELAEVLLGAGLLRGCDRKAHGGEWDLPPRK